MVREELHRKISEIFFHKDFLVKIFINEISEKEIIEALDRLEGRKITIRFRDPQVKNIAKKYGGETEFYNAFLEVLIKKYKDYKNIQREIEKWKRRSFLQYL